MFPKTTTTTTVYIYIIRYILSSICGVCWTCARHRLHQQLPFCRPRVPLTCNIRFRNESGIRGIWCSHIAQSSRSIWPGAKAVAAYLSRVNCCVKTENEKKTKNLCGSLPTIGKKKSIEKMEKSTSSKHRDSLLGNYKRDYTVIKNGDHIPSGIASSSGTRKRKKKKNIIVTLAIDFFFFSFN